MRHVNRSASRPTRGATEHETPSAGCAREARHLVDADPSGHDGAHDRPTPDAPDALSPVKRPYVGDYHGELHGAREAIAVGLPTILLALAVGFCVGAVVWAALGISSLLVKLLWTDLRSVFDVAWYPLALCTIGGLVIGLWTRFSGTRIELLDSVMGQVKRTGGYHVKSVPKSLVSFFLPLAFGGSIGPEAGLTGLIAAACTWIGTTLKRAGLKAKSVTDLTLSATLSAVFGTPFLGIVATADDGMPRAEDYAFRRPAKIVLYTAAAFGAFGGISLISSIPGMSSGLPRFGAFDAGPLEYAWFAPIVVAGWLLAMLFHGAETAAAKLGARLAAYPVLSALLCGALIGLAGTFLPDVLFAGEEQSTEIMGTWTSMGAATLLLTGALKLVATPLCQHLGWVGGHFFPSIFAGISFSYGLAALTGVAPLFCVTVCVTSLVAGIMRKPFAALALLILCFPLDGVLWMGLAAVLGAALPMPKVVLKEKA